MLMVIAELFTMAKTWKQPKCPPTDERIKTWYTQTHTHTHTDTHTHTKEYYSAKKKAVMLFSATWMDLDMIILSKVSQKDKYQMTSLICEI